MRDKDQKLLWEAYQQLNEALSVGDTVRAITNAWVKSNGDKEVYRKHIDTIKDAAGERVWRAATGQLFRIPAQELDDDMLEVIDAVTPVDIPELPKSDKPSFQQQFGHLQASPDDIPEMAMDNERAKALTDDLIEKHDMGFLNEPQFGHSRGYIERAFLALVEHEFEHMEAALHFEDNNVDTWLLGDESFGDKYAKVQISVYDGIFRARFETNVWDGEDPYVTSVSLQSPEVYELAEDIRKAAEQINGEDDQDPSNDPNQDVY